MLLVAVCAGWNFWWSTATARLARYLDIDDVSSTEKIEAGLLRRHPVGTPIQDVAVFLEGQGLRRDGGISSYYFSNDKGAEFPDQKQATAIACEFAYTTTSIQFVKESYRVWFVFDEKQRLKSVKVYCNLTGL